MVVTLTIHSVDGVQEVELQEGRLTVGRGDAAHFVINDDGLSRVHASFNREGDRVWIMDEGSTNGSFVNGTEVSSAGTPLSDGDEIYIGNTTIVIRLDTSSIQADLLSIDGPPTTGLPVPVIVASAGVVLILLTAIVIGVAYRNSANRGLAVKNRNVANLNRGEAISTDSSPSPSIPGPTQEATSEEQGNLPTSSPASTKLYSAMNPDERRQFVGSEALHVARMIGKGEGVAFPPEVVARIKVDVDQYAYRLKGSKPSGPCTMHHDLTTLLTRAGSYAPVVVKAFNEKGLSPQVGIYLAMIEAEYCPCLSSGTGPKGYFQFASATARRYGVKDVSHWTDRRPDDRCNIDIMAPIAAQYMKDLVVMFGTGTLSVPLAIAAYNSGEGGLNSNLEKALQAAQNSERSFWTMVTGKDRLSVQFQRENIRYVPKFFAAAIVGENPRVFGVNLLPISAYAQPQTSGTAR